MTVDGATWSWPNTLAGVEPGGDVLVFAHYETTRPPAVRVQFSDSSIASHVVHTLAVEAPLVERAWARARIERIQHAQARLDDDTPAHRDMDERIVALSTHYRVLTDLTALLVLETDNDYRRFGIPRDGRADILTADGGSVRLRRRSKTPTKPLHVDEDLPLEEEQQPDTRAQRVSSATRHRGEEGTMGTARSASAWAVDEDDQDVWGGLTGTEVDEAFGLGGLGSTASASGVLGVMGAGRGGGGDGEGTIGLGNVGLIGKGGGSGSGSGYGMDSGAGFGGRGSHGLGSLPMDSMQMFADGPWANTNPMHGSRLPGEAMPPARRIDGLRRPRHVAVPRIRRGRPQVMGMLDADIIRRVVRHHANEVRYCYNQGLASNPTAGGRVEVAFTLDTSGTVTKSIVKESTLHDKNIGLCIAKATGRWRFPRPAAGLVHVVMPFELAPDTVAKRRSRSSPPRKRKRPATAPHTGRYAETRRLLDAGRDRDAYALASSWVRTQPEDTLGLLALGEALEHRGRTRLAARVYGSLIDLHPSRADIRRAAGQRLQALGKDGLPLAIDTFAKAVAARPDQPTGARLHAWALVEQGRHAEAFAVLREAFDRRYPRGRFARVHSVLHRDLSIVAAAWSAADPQAAKAGLAYTKVTTATVPSTRFVLSWETDTTDLDLTLHAPESRRRRQRRLADVTTGYGPEEYVVPGKTMPDRLQATVQYYDRGAMGHALGAVQLVRHDGHGGVTIESRPFVLMQQGSTANLGSFELGDPALARPS
ncbi:MAG: AgmX/PglI C-terminal domain-containing protein [Deltaproteobacteria bacterium]|nr:AgmX/PglI C-terminal domain-containing protein [Deltaproteobacteria bacterium]